MIEIPVSGLVFMVVLEALFGLLAVVYACKYLWARYELEDLGRAFDIEEKENNELRRQNRVLVSSLLAIWSKATAAKKRKRRGR